MTAEAAARPRCVVPDCDRPLNGGRICTNHITRLIRDLRAIRKLVPDLELTATRQTAGGSGSSGAGNDPGLPLAWNSSDLAWVLTDTLQTWVVHIAGHPLDPTLRGVGQPDELAAFLIASRNRIRTDPSAGQLYDELTWVVSQTRTAVFGPGPLMALGPCDKCQHDLRAQRRQIRATCPRCGNEYDVAERRQLLLSRAEDKLLTAAELSRALPELLGEQLRELKASRIYTWASRGRLIARPGRRYRVGDVLQLLDVDLDIA